MSIWKVVIITLVIYSCIGLLIYIVTDGFSYALDLWGLGIFGLFFLCVCEFLCLIDFVKTYLVSKRRCSIFEEESSHEKFKCAVDDTGDVSRLPGYKLVADSILRKFCTEIPDIPIEVLHEARSTSCSYCKHGSVCCQNFRERWCSHDELGLILKYDKFERK